MLDDGRGCAAGKHVESLGSQTVAIVVPGLEVHDFTAEGFAIDDVAVHGVVVVASGSVRSYGDFLFLTRHFSF